MRSLTIFPRFAFVVSLLSFLVVSTAFSDGKQFTLHNQTGKEIKEVYIGPTNSERFGEDVTGGKKIASGSSLQVTLHSGAPGNQWDVRIVFDDDSSASLPSLDLSTIRELTVTYKDGKASATSK